MHKASRYTQVGVLKATHWCLEKVQLAQINPTSSELQTRGQQKWHSIQVDTLKASQYNTVQVCSSKNKLQHKSAKSGWRISSPSQLQIQEQAPNSHKLFGSREGKIFTDAGKQKSTGQCTKCKPNKATPHHTAVKLAKAPNNPKNNTRSKAVRDFGHRVAVTQCSPKCSSKLPLVRQAR